MCTTHHASQLEKSPSVQLRQSYEARRVSGYLRGRLSRRFVAFVELYDGDMLIFLQRRSTCLPQRDLCMREHARGLGGQDLGGAGKKEGGRFHVRQDVPGVPCRCASLSDAPTLARQEARMRERLVDGGRRGGGGCSSVRERVGRDLRLTNERK